jgi:hypothetical protein
MFAYFRANYDSWFVVAAILLIVDALLYLACQRRIRLLSRRADGAAKSDVAKEATNRYNRFILLRHFVAMNDMRLTQLGNAGFAVRIAYVAWIGIGLFVIFAVD